MRHLLLLFCVLTLVARGSHSRRNLTFFECVFEDTNQPCDAIREPPLSTLFDAFRNNEYLLNCMSNTSQTDAILPISPVLLFIIPEDYLELMDMQIIMNQVKFYSENRPLLRKLLETVYSPERKTIFWTEINEMVSRSSMDILVDLGIELESGQIFSEVYFFHYLFHIPAKFIALNERTTAQKMAMFFSVLLSSKDSGWRLSAKAEKRLWTYLALKHGLYGDLSKWNSDVLLSQRNVLFGATPDELSTLNRTLINRAVYIWTNDFSTLQIRSLFNVFYVGNVLSFFTLNYLSRVSIHLTPQQLAQFYPNSKFGIHSFTPVCKSRASAKQILEFQRVEMLPFAETPAYVLSRSSELVTYNKLIFAKPLLYFRKFLHEPIEIGSLKKIESPCLSDSQVYSLLGKGEGLSLFNDDLINCQTCLKAVSTKTFISQKKGLTKDKISFILSHLRPGNAPLTFAILEDIWDILKDRSILESIFNNENYEYYLNLIPPKYIRGMDLEALFSNSAEDLTKSKPLPPIFASTVLQKHNVSDWSWDSLVNGSYPFSTVFQGLTCQDINKILPMDFLATISFYNQYRKLNNKTFQKELHVCCALKLIDYLSLKAVLYEVRPYSFLSLLSNSDILAVGGPVLLQFPGSYLNDRRLGPLIIGEIGRMSLSDMMLSARISTFRKLYTMFVEEEVLDEILFEIGNLTLLLDSSEIAKIKPQTFKLLLEADFIDKRLCANIKERQEWTKLIISAFGEPSSWTSGTLEALGDMLLAVSDVELMKIQPSAWIEVGDLLHTQYFDSLSSDSKMTYFDMCLENLKWTESVYYQNAVQKLILWHLVAAEMQLETVKTFGTPRAVSAVTTHSTNEDADNQLNTTIVPIPETTTTTNTPGLWEVVTTTPSTLDITNESTLISKEGSTLTTVQDTASNIITETPEFISNATHLRTEPFNENLQPLNTHSGSISNNSSFKKPPVHTAAEMPMNDRIQSFQMLTPYNFTRSEPSSSVLLDFESANTMDYLDSDEYADSSLEGSDEGRPLFEEMRTRLRRSPKTSHISCDAYKMVGKSSEKVIQAHLISSMTDDELNDCSELFGQMNLYDDVKDAVWKRISKEPFHLLGSLVAKARIKDVEKILSNPSSNWFLEEITVLGLHNTDKDVRDAVLNTIESVHGLPLGVSEVVALGPFICGLKDVDDAIRPEVFLKTSVYLGETLPCSCDAMSQLAILAESEGAYGDVSSWDAEVVESLGCIITGLKRDRWRVLNNSTKRPLHGLKPHVADHLPIELIRELSEGTIMNLRQSTAITLLDKYEYVLSIWQLKLLNSYYQHPFSQFDLESGTSSLTTINTISLVILLQLVVFACYQIC